ncbi:Arc family DNA-binding protein [Acetobacter sp.]|uniref:Arc family DNA-binding protein n=1 Tax=Acetobacter sp. TaxID=440 RepID=UPI0039E8B071
MTRRDPQLHIRVPEEVKAWLEKNARENERTLNGEAVFQLKQGMERKENEPNRPPNENPGFF